MPAKSGWRARLLEAKRRLRTEGAATFILRNYALAKRTVVNSSGIAPCPYFARSATTGSTRLAQRAGKPTRQVTNSKDADPGISGLRPSSAYTTVGCDRTDDGRTPRPDEDSARVPIYERGAGGA